MSEKTSREEVMEAFAEFKRANDQALAQKLERGAIDTLLQEKVDKANAAISDALRKHEQRADSLERRFETDGIFGGGRGPAAPTSDKEILERFNAVIVPVRKVAATLEQLRAYRPAFNKYLRAGVDGMAPEERAAMTVGSDPSGGYFALPDTSGRIVKRLFETSPMRQLASVQTVSGPELTGITELTEAGAGWVGEITPRTETTTPTIGKWSIPLREQYAEPKASQNLIDDAAIDIEAWLGDKVTDKFSRSENTAFVVGDGNLKPRGFATYPTLATGDATRAWGVMEHVITGVNGGFHATLPGDALIALSFTLNPGYLPNANYVMTRSTEAAIRMMKDGQGNYLWQPNFEMRTGRQLAGFPIVNFEDMPVIATNSLSIAFGDFRQGYQIIEKAGITVLRDPFTAKPFVKFYTTKRVGGDVIDFNAIKFLKFSAA